MILMKRCVNSKQKNMFENKNHGIIFMKNLVKEF